MVCIANGSDTQCDVTPAEPVEEVCDGVDNDCDGQIDEGGCILYYRDVDGDGYGNPQDFILNSKAPIGFVANNTDCNDMDSNIHPGANEIPCNGKDDDCLGGDDTSYDIAIEEYIEMNFGELDIEITITAVNIYQMRL